MMKELLYMDKFAKEHCYMVALNGTRKMIGVFFMPKKTIRERLLSASKIYTRALLVNAVMIFIKLALTVVVSKEPLAKQAALMYNLIRKVYRTRSSDCPQ